MKRFVLLFALFIMVTGCDIISGENTVTLAQLDTQLKDIQAFVNKEGCTEATECRYLPIGSKACGGPSGFIIFSDNIDVEVLKKMIDKYSEDQKTYNKENNIISDCSIPNPPATLDCVDGSCIEIR